MTNINRFLEKECGFKNNATNIIEKEIKKYNFNNDSPKKIEKYLIVYENNFKMIPEILSNIEYNNSFYDYLKYKQKSLDEIDISNLEITDFPIMIENKIKYYSEKNEELEELIQKLKEKIKNIEIKKQLMEKKYNDLKHKNINQNNTDNLSTFEVISLQDEIDKNEKEIKTIKQNIDNIPNIKKEIETEIKEKQQNIKDNTKYIEILEYFPTNLYIHYLKENHEKIKTKKNLENKIISIREKQKIYNKFIFLIFIINIVEKYYNFFNVHQEIFTLSLCVFTFYITINCY